MEAITLIVNAAVFKRLQSYTVPLVDDVNSVLTRIFDHWDATRQPSPPGDDVKYEEDLKTYPFYVTSRGIRLPVGQKMFADYRGEKLQAVVTPRGIEYNGRTYSDPSSAAVAAKKDAGASDTTASTNGWKFWQMVRNPDAKRQGIAVYIDYLRKPK